MSGEVKCPKCGSNFVQDNGPVEVGAGTPSQITRLYLCLACGHEFESSEVEGEREQDV